MKNQAKKKLESRGIVAPRSEKSRVHNAPHAIAHDDKRKPTRAAQKIALKQNWQHETARTRGPFPFFGAFLENLEARRLTKGEIFC